MPTTPGTPRADVVPDDGSVLTPDVPPSVLTPSPPEAADLGDLGRALKPESDLRGMMLVGLFVLATLYTLHFARSFLLPVVLAILLDFLLSPVVRALKKVRIREPFGAAIVIFASLGAIGGTFYYLAEPAAGWVQRAPESLGQVQRKLQSLRKPVEQVTRAAETVQEATDVGGGAKATTEVTIAGPSITKQIFGGTTSFLGSAAIVVFLTYFLLASGDLFLQKLIKVLPQFKDKKRAVAIAREIEAQTSVYMLTSTLINAGVGLLTGLAVWAVGMPNPALWGIVAAILNFVPYIGALITVAILGLASLLAFDSPGKALVVPVIYFVINTIEGNLVSPMVLGNRLRLNTVAVFIGLIFWWYLWGIPGAIMAVPMMATMKIFCDHFDGLAPIGEFLGT